MSEEIPEEDAFDVLRQMIDLDIELEGIGIEYSTMFEEDEYLDLEEEEFYDELLDEDYDVD